MAHDDSAVAHEQREAYQYDRDNGHLQWLQKAKRCEAFFAGDHWDSLTREKLRRRKRPAMTMNKVLANMMAVMGEQLENRVDVSFRPSASGSAETAGALDKLYLHIINDNKLDFVESEMYDDGIITSRGYYDARISFDDHVRGEVVVRTENPQNVLLDPDAEEYDPKKWKRVTTSRWLSLDEIKRFYGEAAAKELKGRAKSNFDNQDFIDIRPQTFGGPTMRVSDEKADPSRRRYRLIERQHRKLAVVPHFVDLTTGDTQPIPTQWNEDRIRHIVQMTGVGVINRTVEHVWWTSTIDDMVLHNKPSIYRTFTIVPYFPIFRRGSTIGLVESLIDPQEMYNKSMSQMFHIINTTANSGWKYKSGALKNMTAEELEERGAETGLVLELDDINNAEKIAPNPVPTGLDRMSFLMGEDLKDLSGVSDSLRGMDRADVAAKAIAAKKASGSLNFARPVDNLRRTRMMLAEKVLELVKDFYTEPRTYKITGGGLLPQEETLVVNQVTPEGEVLNDISVGEYSVVITAVPARNDFEDSQFEEAVRLRELGVQVPDHILIEHSHLNRKAELADEIKQRSGFGEPSEIEQQMQLLEQQLKELEAQKVQVENEKIQSEVALNFARAQETAARAARAEDEEGEDAMALEEQKLIAEVRLQREKQVMENNLAERKLAAEIELKQGELDIKREELELKRQAAEAAQKDQPTGNDEEKSTNV